MERLTDKINDYWATNNKAHIYYLDKNESIFVGNAIDRLAEFEDFMEEQNISDLKTLSDTLHKVNLELEKMQALKDRWEKLKEYLLNTIKEKDNSLKYYKFREIVDKMQELEQGVKDDTNKQ